MSRTIIAKMKRTEDEESKLKYNIMHLKKWEFMRIKRAEYEAQVAERIRNRKQMTMLLMHAFKDQYIRKIWEKFSKRREQLRIAMLRATGSNMVKSVLRIKLRRRGPNVHVRTLREVRNTLQMT